MTARWRGYAFWGRWKPRQGRSRWPVLQHAALALLLIERGQVLSAERMIDLLLRGSRPCVSVLNGFRWRDGRRSRGDDAAPGQQGLRSIIRLLYRHPREGLAVALGPPRQQCRLPVSPAVRLARRSDRHRLAPAIQSATNGAPSLVAPADGGASRRPDRLPARVQCAAGRSVHERRCRPCLRAGPPRICCYRGLNGTIGGRQGPKVQARRRWYPARLEEDRAVKDRIAGFLPAALPLSVWLGTNMRRQPPGAEPGKPGALAPDARRVAGCGRGPVMLASPLAWWWPSAWWRLAPFCPHAERRIIISEG